MEVFRSYYSEPHQFVSSDNHWSYDQVPDESSSAYDNGNACKPNLSDEEVMLASNNPKKRAGRKKVRETRHPVYRGIRQRNSEKWVCEMREPKKNSRIWLGTFPTAEMAARAHDVAALALKGRSTCLNFADSAWRLPIPTSTDTKVLQKAAAEAAEAFRPVDVEGIVSSSSDVKEEMSQPLEEHVYYMDEEEIFGMPGLLNNMAEGLMLPPPHCVDEETNYVEIDADNMSLWSYSF